MPIFMEERSAHHGADDFVTSASLEQCQWLDATPRKKYQLTTKTVGDSPELRKEVRVLNREIAWHCGVGLTFEADQRHADLLIAEYADKIKPVKTPVVSDGEESYTETEDVARQKQEGRLNDRTESESDAETLDGQPVTKYRWAVARANFLAIDSPDIMYAVKEAARRMAPQAYRLRSSGETGPVPERHTKNAILKSISGRPPSVDSVH